MPKKSLEDVQKEFKTFKAYQEGFRLVEYIDSKNVLVKCELDEIYKVTLGNLQKGRIPIILSCLNKTSLYKKRFKKIHKSLYDYSKFVYLGSETNSEIICNIHGSFYQSPLNHVRGGGCHLCGYKKSGDAKRLSQKQVITIFKSIHNNLYDYSKFIYIDSTTKGIVVCDKHGDFLQSYSNHKYGKGCPICANNKKYDWEQIALGKLKQGKPITFYLIIIKNKKETFLKYGITSDDITRRYRGFKYEYKPQLIIKDYTSYKNVQDIENYFNFEIAAEFKYEPTFNFGGKSECIKLDYIDEVIEIIETLGSHNSNLQFEYFID